jgi:hypothetical protein
MRQKRRRIEQKVADKWHRENPNRGISDDQWGSLCRQSGFW